MSNNLRHLANLARAGDMYARARRAIIAVRAYHRLALLNTSFSQCVGSVFVLVLKSATEQWGPILIATSVRLSRHGNEECVTHFVLALLFIGALSTVMEFIPIFLLSRTYEMSAKFKQALKGAGPGQSGKYLRRLKRSCRVLKNQIGPLYFADRPLILTMLKFKCEAVIFLLLNF
jgi:hypothetical protein